MKLYAPNTITKFQNNVQNKFHFHLAIIGLLIIMGITTSSNIGSFFVFGFWLLVLFRLGFDLPKQGEELLLENGYAWDAISGHYIKDDHKFKIDDWTIENNRIVIKLKEYKDSDAVVVS